MSEIGVHTDGMFVPLSPELADFLRGQDV